MATFGKLINNLSRTVLFCLLLTYVRSDSPTKPICTVPTYSCGPPPPTLDKAYTMKGLVLDVKSGNFKWREEFFDPENYRAKIVEIFDGRVKTELFDFEKEIYTTYSRLHPGAQPDKDLDSEFLCLTEPLRQISKEDNIFGHYPGPAQRPTLFGANEVLGFGGPYPVAYNGTDTMLKDRALTVNKFDGCINDNQMEVDYYWTSGVATSSGEVTVPARVEIKGGYQSGLDGDGVWHGLETVKDIAWFESSKDIPFNTFQVPARMDCQRLYEQQATGKPLPKTPKYFSARIESFVAIEDSQGLVENLAFNQYDEFNYDFEEKLVRHDFYPIKNEEKSETRKLFKHDVPLTAVFDFNTGVAYFTDKSNGMCRPEPIPTWAKFAKVTEGGMVEIVDPQTYFGLNDQFLFYKGKYMVRDIQTEAWYGEIGKIDPNSGISGYMEIFFTSDGYHLEADDLQEYQVPVRTTSVIPTEYNKQKAFRIVENNIYKFKAAKPSLDVYDISGCVMHHPRRMFVLTFKSTDAQLIDEHKHKFIQAARIVIKDTADLGSPLRVQDLQVFKVASTNAVRLAFTLLDVPTVVGDVAAPRKGATLNQAVQNLIKNTISGVIFIPISFNGEIHSIESEMNSLREVDQINNKIIDVAKAPSIPVMPDETSLPPKFWASAFKTQLANSPQMAPGQDDDSKGYSPGSLGGLAVAMLLIGLCLGVALMFYYLKRTQRGDTEIANLDLGPR